MTDDLIEQLRCYPANRLCRQVADALEAKDARIAELKAALKPFADKVEYTTGTNDDDYMDPVFKLGECRAARAAYLGEKNDEEQFNALLVLIDAMIDDKIIGDNHTSHRKMLLENDIRRLLFGGKDE